MLDQAALYAYRKGSILVAAAGNSYQTGNCGPVPRRISERGRGGLRGRLKPVGLLEHRHIAPAAPGENVLGRDHARRRCLADGYDLQSGTSFATPHVAAALALVAAANPTLSAAQIVQVTELTAQDDASGNGRDTQLGYGIVRPDRAVATALLVQVAALPAGTAAPAPVQRTAGAGPSRRGHDPSGQGPGPLPRRRVAHRSAPGPDPRRFKPSGSRSTGWSARSPPRRTAPPCSTRCPLAVAPGAPRCARPPGSGPSAAALTS